MDLTRKAEQQVEYSGESSLRTSASRAITRLWQPVARFGSDRQGGTAVQALFLMPAVILAFVVSIALWQAVNIRKSLNDGTYQAMRYLSLYPPANTDTFYWAGIARDLITVEMLSNPWVSNLTEANLRVTVTLFDGNACGDAFRLEASYAMFAPSGSTSEDSYAGLMPNMKQIQLLEDRTGQVLCD